MDSIFWLGNNEYNSRESKSLESNYSKTGFISRQHSQSFESIDLSHLKNKSSKLKENNVDNIKTKLISIFNNAKHGWLLNNSANFKSNSSVWLIGKMYRWSTKNQSEYDLFMRDFSKLIWLTYRQSMPKFDLYFPNSSIEFYHSETSDVGWGCMLRCGQMLLANTLLIQKEAFFGTTIPDKIKREILILFADAKNALAPFSLYALMEKGMAEGKSIGKWYGPVSISILLRDILKSLNKEYFKINLEIFVAFDGLVSVSDILKSSCISPICGTINDDNMKPVIQLDQILSCDNILPITDCYNYPNSINHQSVNYEHLQNDFSAKHENKTNYNGNLTALPLLNYKIGRSDINSSINFIDSTKNNFFNINLFNNTNKVIVMPNKNINYQDQAMDIAPFCLTNCTRVHIDVNNKKSKVSNSNLNCCVNDKVSYIFLNNENSNTQNINNKNPSANTMEGINSCFMDYEDISLDQEFAPHSSNIINSCDINAHSFEQINFIENKCFNINDDFYITADDDIPQCKNTSFLDVKTDFVVINKNDVREFKDSKISNFKSMNKDIIKNLNIKESMLKHNKKNDQSKKMNIQFTENTQFKQTDLDFFQKDHKWQRLFEFFGVWQQDSLIMIPLRLGLEKINECYIGSLKTILCNKSCIGILGGLPRKAYYIVGFEDDKIIYLDPHNCQDHVNMLDPDFPLSTFSCLYPRKMKFEDLDPSLCVAFLCQSKNDFLCLITELPELMKHNCNDDTRLFEFIEKSTNDYN